jgi:hypothetical protein
MAVQDGSQPVGVRPKGTLLETVRAVLWGFLGVRRQSEYEKDIHRLNPLHLIAVGFVLTLFFVGGLMALVHWIV